MSHALSGLAAETQSDQLVVAPHCTIEKDQRRAAEPGFEFRRHSRAGRQEIEMLARRLVADPQTVRVACAVVSGGVSLSLQVPRALAGNGEWQNLDAGGRSIRQFRFEGRVDGHG